MALQQLPRCPGRQQPPGDSKTAYISLDFNILLEIPNHQYFMEIPNHQYFIGRVRNWHRNSRSTMASQQLPGDSKTINICYWKISIPIPLLYHLNNIKITIFHCKTAQMLSQQRPGNSKTINIPLEKCANRFTAISWRFQTIPNGFTAAPWRFLNY